MPDYVKKAPERPAADIAAVENTVRDMLGRVRDEGDAAVRHYAKTLDKWEQEGFRVSGDEIRAVTASLPETFKEDFALGLRNIQEFARRQRDSMSEFTTEIAPGVQLGQKLIPIERVGCYIPGGKYPLISAAAMSVGTTAGVGHIVAARRPPGHRGHVPAYAICLVCRRGR
jgi:histidinol dehydrogenase